MTEKDSLIQSRPKNTWHIAVHGGGDWPDEHIDLDSDTAYSYWFEGGVVIQTHPTGFGDFHCERVIPWREIIEWSRDGRPVKP